MEDIIFNQVYADSVTLLHDAALHGKIDVVQDLLAQGKSVNCTDNRGWASLHYAVQGRRLECIKFLLQQDEIEINAESYECQTPLLLAILNAVEAYPIAKVLLEAGADPNSKRQHPFKNCLTAAITLDDKELVKLLLINGADINAHDDYFISSFHVAVKLESSLQMIAIIRTYMQQSHIQFIKRPQNPLHDMVASQYNFLPVFEEFMTLPMARELLNCQDDNGDTPICLLCGCISGNTGRQPFYAVVIDKLLDYGADPNIGNYNKELPVTKLLSRANNLPHIFSDRQLDRLIGATAMSEMKKCNLLSSLFYEYLVCQEQMDTLDFCLSWLNPINITLCSVSEFLRIRQHLNNDALTSIATEYFSQGHPRDSICEPFSMSLLSVACGLCRSECGFKIVKMLLARDSEINPKCQRAVSPLIAACLAPETIYKEKIVKMLVQEGSLVTVRLRETDLISATVMFALACSSLQYLEILLSESTVMELFGDTHVIKEVVKYLQYIW